MFNLIGFAFGTYATLASLVLIVDYILNLD